MRYLGLDLGSKTLGLSISDKSGLIARSLKTIRHNEDYSSLISEVKTLVAEENVEAIVLGYPKNMDNSIGQKAKLSEEFKKMLEESLNIPVYLQDERLTTMEATRTLIDFDISRKKRKKVVDSVASTIILQSYLDRRNKNGKE